MRIVVDTLTAGASLQSGKGGMFGYVHALLPALARAAPHDQFVVVAGQDAEVPSLTDAPNALVVRVALSASSRTMRVLRQGPAMLGIYRRYRPDVYFSVCNTISMRPTASVARVVALHSLQFLLYPHMFGRLRSRYLRWAVGTSVRGADCVIAVSDACASDIATLLGVSPSRIAVAHPGVTHPAVDDASAAVPRAPYILAVSTLYGFKNYQRLIAAFAAGIVARGLPHDLVILGGDADVSAASLAADARRLGVADRLVMPGPVPHDQVGRYIAKADAFAYPSLYETFGQPPLEAMCAGVPVLAADIPAIREVCGRAALLVDPLSISDIADGLFRLVTDSSLRAALRHNGQERTLHFHWDRCASAVMRALRAARRVGQQ